MSTYRIVIDRAVCSRFGACAERAHAVFALDGGIAELRVRASDDPRVVEPSLGRRLRAEHWTGASGQGAAVAHTILGDGIRTTSRPTSGRRSAGCFAALAANRQAAIPALRRELVAA
jgi:hypothetical protein